MASKEQIEVKDLDKEFNSAAENLKIINNHVSTDDLLYFYARFKQVKDGPCKTERPSFWSYMSKQKWEAWRKLGEMSKEEAMKEYVECMEKIDPLWTRSSTADQVSRKEGTFGISISTLQCNVDVALEDHQKTPFDWVKENCLSKLISMSQQSSLDVNVTDDEGLTLLHWAADRGHTDIVEFLLKKGAKVNAQDQEGQTALHYACTCDHTDVVELLLKNGANLTLMDDEGQKPVDVASSKDVLQLISKFK